MKKTTIAILLSLISFNLLAQDLDGIGILRMGKYVSVMDSLAAQMNTKIKKGTFIGVQNTLFNAHISGIWETTFKTPTSERCPFLRIYTIRGYKIGEMKLSVEAYFMNDTLYKLRSESEINILKEKLTLLNALVAKYGTPKSESSSKEVLCNFSNGNQQKLIEETTNFIWINNNKNILSNYFYKMFYGLECNKIYTDYLLITDFNRDEYVKKCENITKPPSKETLDKL